MKIMKIKRFFSKINFQIAVSFLAISWLCVLLVSAIAYYSASQMILGNIRKQTEDSVFQASNYISAYLEKIKALSDLIAMNTETKEALKNADSKAIETLAGMVNISAKGDPRIQTIAVISKNGFAITSNSNMAIPLSDNMMEESWYKAAVSSNQMPAITSIRHGDFTMDKASWVISISHEIVDEKKEHLGVVLIDIGYQFIEDYIAALNLGATGYAYILDSRNQVLYHPDESILMDQMKADELRQLSDESTSGSQIIIKNQIPHSDWRLIGISSMENVSRLKSRFIKTILAVNLSLVLMSVIVSFALSNKLTKPIFELQKAMQEMDEKWGHLTVSRRSSLEIKALAREYNALLDRIKRLTEDIARQENAKRIFELKALQSQINPHFLYNTLDTILWLAEFGENDKVVAVSKALGEMLRVSLNINQPMVPLALELAHTENYLKIQQQRYIDKISYQISGEAKLLTAVVPKLILQPIVENSIYHGIRPSKEAGQIAICYEKEGADLKITVTDNGVGCHPEKGAKEIGLIKTKLGGVGMKNVDQRIKLLCGGEYGITIQNRPSGGTMVIYRLKLIEAEE